MNFVSFIFQDRQRNKANTKGKLIAMLFRIGNYSRNRSLLKILMLPYLLFYRIFVEWILGIELPYNTAIGKGLKILHGQGLVVNANTTIGCNVTLRQNTTIGNAISGGKSPVLEDNVDIGANCVVIGHIVIGQGTVIGAGSVVVRDLPDGCVAVGNPARVIRSQNIT